MELEILNKSGESTGRKAKLPSTVFGIEPNDHAIYLDVKRIMASRHRGTHKTKERSEIHGSTRKLRRQKGTGMARVGDIKSPIFRGGGRAFGPRVRSYDIKLNKKVRRLARKSALSYMAKDKQILVLEDMKFEKPRTRDFVDVLKGLKLEDKKAVFVSGKDGDVNVGLSMRNIPNVVECDATSLNTYDISNCNSLVLSESAVEELVNILK